MKALIIIAIGLIMICTSSQTYATRYALLVGIDKYDPDYGADRLYSCVNDAIGMRRCLGEDATQWPSSNMTLQSNAEASKSAIRNALGTLASSALAGDVVLYFHSSHGGQHSGTDTFISAYDDNYEDYELASDLGLFADGVKVIVIIDACNSAGLFKGNGSSATTSGTKRTWDFAGNVMRYYNAAVKTRALKAASIGWITACDYDELSWAGPCYSLFTGKLVYGFAYGDADSSGTLSFQELYDFAAPRTLLENSEQTVQTHNGSLLASTEAAATVPFDPDVQTAIDQVTVPVHALHGPAALWVSQTDTTHDGVDAAQSGDIGDGQASDFGCRVVGPGTLTYWWNVSSEKDYDWLSIFVNGIEIAYLTGVTDWQQKTFRIGPGEALLQWTYLKDEDISYGQDCGWVDQVTWTTDAGTGSTPLAEAIDNTLLPVFTGGDQHCFQQTTITHDGSDAVQTGACTSEQTSWFTAELVGPGELSFWWQVSSELNYDYFSFAIDDEVKSRISGDQDWQQQVYSIGAGTHTIGWSYSKDWLEDYGSDCGRVDQVVWTETATTSDISNHLYSVSIEPEISYRNPEAAWEISFKFWISLQTDTTVTNVFVQCPSGNSFNITEVDPDGENLEWHYGLLSSTPVFDQFGDGEYMITLNYEDGTDQTTAIPFTLEDGTTPIPDVSERPEFTSPSPLHGSLFVSPQPNTLVWTNVDPKANVLVIQRWNPPTEENEEFIGLYSDTFSGPEVTGPLSTRIVDSLSFAPTNWIIDIAAIHVQVATNSDGVACEFLKSVDDYNLITVVDSNDDYDGDGLLNGWEAQYFGGPTNAIASEDSDHDGQSNLEESITGMDPTSMASVFMITNAIPLILQDYFVIEWPAVPGRSYSTSWTKNLMDGFQSLGTDIFYPRNSYTDTVHGAEHSGFYQVEVEIQ